MLDLASKYRDVKIWGRGKNVSGHRHFSPAGKQVARRSYNRAARRQGREICRSEAYQGAEVTTMANEVTAAEIDAQETEREAYKDALAAQDDIDECRCCCCTGECREVFEYHDSMFAGFVEGYYD